MVIITPRSKIIRLTAKTTKRGTTGSLRGGSIAHISPLNHSGNVSALKDQLKRMVVGKPKVIKRVKF